MLAPMSGITSLPFRKINRLFGCEFAFTEMICIRSLAYKSEKTLDMLKSDRGDAPLGVQLLGEDTEYLKRALEVIRHHAFDIIDFNAACPMRKVTAKGKGAMLLKDLDKLSRLLKVMVKSTVTPVTVKVRTGWDRVMDAAGLARRLEDTGIHGIFVHGRTRRQGYSGNVDYGAIEKMKKSVKIPVIGSGDIISAGLTKRMIDETGCDAVLVARGALGNPWIFRDIRELLLKGVEAQAPGKKEAARIMKRHLDMNVKCFGERKAVIEFRKHFVYYTKGLRNIKDLRRKAFRVKRKKDMSKLIDRL